MNKIGGEEKPAYAQAVLWGLYSATATLSAFVLPVHFYALFRWKELDTVTQPIFKAYLFIVLFCAFFHGLYRTKTIFHDLGFGKYERAISLAFYLLLIVATATLFFVSFVKEPL